VLNVQNGDTITVLDSDKVQHKIRLVGIDAPESGQAFGAKSKRALSAKVFGKTVRVEWSERDHCARTLGKVLLDRRWINREMIADGLAWHYKRYSRDTALDKAESKAQADRIGLWVEPHPVPPWDYRRKPKATNNPNSKRTVRTYGN
jgi:endonuclease YncB( thermonuclease family)